MDQMVRPGIDEDEVICKCMQVKETVIRTVISRGNFETIDQVTDACTAGGGCHSCHILIQLFLDEHHGKVPSKDQLLSIHSKKVKKKGILSTFFSKLKSSKS